MTFAPPGPRTGPLALLLGAVLAAALPAARARGGAPGPVETPLSTRVGGDVSLYVDQYDVNGNSFESPFEFTGFMSYLQLNLRFERRANPFRVVRGQFIGIANDNDYRSPDDGVVIERLNLFDENGTARLPYRLEAGDTYAFFSQRTIQRTLKGGSIEIQAPIGESGLLQSFQVLTGNANPTWRDLSLLSDFTTGASWLLSHPERGQIGVSYLDNVREDIEFLDAFRRDQRIASVAGELPILDERLLLEGEVDHLEERTTPVEGADEVATNGEGLFLQLGGHTRRRIAYRARFESYEDNYRPAGSPIIPDRRSGEGYLSWRSLRGLDVRGRYLRYKDRWEGVNPLETSITGVTIAGPLLQPITSRVTGVLDMFVRDLEQRDRLVDNKTGTASLELARASGHAWTPRLRLFYQDRDDESVLSQDERTAEVRVGSDHEVRLWGFGGTFGPSVLYRTIRDHVASSDEFFPGLFLNLVRGRHSFRQSIDLLRQDRQTFGVEDVDTLAYHLVYRFAGFRDDVGFEVDTRDRDPSFGLSTRSLRVGAYWTRRFDHNLRTRPVEPEVEGEAPPPGEPGRFSLLDLRPGTSMDTVRERLSASGISQSSGTAGVATYEITYDPGIILRQQLVTVEADGVLSRASIVFIAPPSIESADFLQLFERFRRTALERFGRPDTFLEEGVATPDLRDALNRGGFYRQMEWPRPGALLRLGIPHRLDDSLTFELQIARELPPERDLNWAAIDLRR